MYPYICDISASMHVAQRTQRNTFYISCAAGAPKKPLCSLCLCGEYVLDFRQLRQSLVQFTRFYLSQIWGK